MDSLFLQVASATRASVDQVKLISCLLVAYPLGSVFIRIPPSRPALRHLFNVAVTAFYFIPILGMPSAFLQLLGDVLITYFVAANVRGSRMPWIVFVLIMGHLTMNHVIRAIYDLSYETFEITGPQMVLTMKLTTFAWNVWDGRRPPKDLDKWQSEKRVTQYPSLLALLGYAFYFPGILVGPSLDFADYMSLVNETLYEPLNERDENKAGRGLRLVPKGRKRTAYRKMLQGLVWLGSYVFFIGKFNLGVTIHDWFFSKNLLFRIGYVQICGFFERTKYYAVWTLTEGASILTGLGFTGYGPSGGTLWEGAANVDILSIEIPSNFKVLLDSWNMKTNVWLRECMYKRVTPKGKKPGFRSSMITFTTSAFWHGVAGGYYLTFSFGGFVQTVQRLTRKNFRPLFLPATYIASRTAPPPPQTSLKRAYDIAGTACSLLILNYAVTPFMLLTMRDSILAWSRLGWYGHVIVGSALVFFYCGGTKLLRRMQAARVKRVGAVVREKTSVDSSADESRMSLMLPPVDEAAREIESSDFMRSINE